MLLADQLECLEGYNDQKTQTKYNFLADWSELKAAFDAVEYIGAVCIEPNAEIEKKFKNAIVEFCKPENGDLVWGTSNKMEALYLSHPEEFNSSGNKYDVEILYKGAERSSLLAGIGAQSYFVKLKDTSVKLKKYCTLNAVLRIKGIDGEYHFRPAVLSRVDDEAKYSAEMCFYTPAFYGSGLRHGMVAEDARDATVFLISPNRNFQPYQKGAQLKQQLVQDCFTCLATFVEWGLAIEAACPKTAQELYLEALVRKVGGNSEWQSSKFTDIDENDSGFVALNEFKRWFKTSMSLTDSFSDKDVEDLFGCIDDNSSGLISLEEFDSFHEKWKPAAAKAPQEETAKTTEPASAKATQEGTAKATSPLESPTE